MTTSRLITCSCVLLLMFACENGADVVMRQNRSIPQAVWNKDNVLRFEIPVSDTSGLYAVSLNVRNRTDYDYRNLYLFVRTQSPDGKTIVDTLNYPLAYDSGEWTGEGGIFSKFRENIFFYRRHVKFHEQGNYIVSIRHGMRDEDLAGIASIGLLLQKSNNFKIP